MPQIRAHPRRSMPYIKNAAVLGRSEERKKTLDIISAAYTSIDTEKVLRDRIRLDNTVLVIGDQVFDLAAFEHVYIVGCGKIACQAAAIVEEILHDKVRDGAVIGLTEHVCSVVSTYQGSHPLPSERNFRASEHIERIGANVSERDLVIAIVGGGGSALLCSSQGECDQSTKLYEAFLNSGGTIDELNIVRRHLSSLKGGGLVQTLYPATIVGLIFSDVPGGSLATVASGPTYRDTSTIEDALAIIERYHLGSYDLVETPKDEALFERVFNIMMVSNSVALEAMANAARGMGLEPIFSSCEPYAFPEVMIETMLRESKPQSVVLLGGEARLVVPEGIHGIGGRNTYLALEAIQKIGNKQLFASFASDGHDNAGVAGALVDATTRARIEAEKLPLDEYKRNRDSTSLFLRTNDVIETGPLDSNVSDLTLLLTES